MPSMPPRQRGKPDPLTAVRRSIDDLDERLVEILVERLDLATEAGRIKGDDGATWVPAREEAVLDRACQQARGRVTRSELARLYRPLFALSRSRQSSRPPKIVVPAAPPSSLALDRLLPEGVSVDLGPWLAGEGTSKRELAVVPAQIAWEGGGASLLPRLLEAGLQIHACLVEGLDWCLARPTGREFPTRLLAPDGVAELAAPVLPAPWRSLPIERGRGATWAAETASREGAGALTTLVAARAHGLLPSLALAAPPLPPRRRWLAVGFEPSEPDVAERWTLALQPSRPEGLAEILSILASSGMDLLHLERHGQPDRSPRPILFLDLGGRIDRATRRTTLEALREKAPLLLEMGAYPLVAIEGDEG